MGTVTARRPRVRVASAIALVGVALATAACSPAPRYNVALFLDGGHPTALLHHCEGSPITELGVTDLTSPSAPDPRAPTPTGTHTDLYVPYWSVRAADSGARPERVRLLTTPSGWRADDDHPFPLEEFQDGYEYMLDTNDVGFPVLVFTLDDLEALDRGEVWARDRRGEEQAMTRDEFTSVAGAHCD
jgi:hypothetical protein